MNLVFQYQKEKDIWCLLNKGKSSSNSSKPTKVYEKLVEMCGENPTQEATDSFIKNYLLDNNINVQKYVNVFQKEWEVVSMEFQYRAERIFNTSLPENFTAYLTVNNRCPYSIEENYFFVSIPGASGRKTVMHELWHFYTWHGLGADQIERLSFQKYNDLKEALTVLLNIECKDLLPEGSPDMGYPQHTELREKILEYWTKDKNIKNLWEYLVTL